MANLARAASPQNPDASRRPLIDALVSKTAALRLLSAALNDMDGVGGDVILAVVLFFINVDLIESGKYAWTIHLEGAGRIMALLDQGVVDDTSTVLRDYIMSDCFVYYILASAFKPSISSENSYFHSARAFLILGRTSANNYFCCPPEVLQILLSATELSHQTTDAVWVAQAGAELIEKALSIEIHTWACTIRTISCFQHIPIESRIHVGSAHRLAACLYILQAIPLASFLVSTTVEELCAAIIHDLSFVPIDDPNFKATVWQAFVVGASATESGMRKWVLDRFQLLLQTCPWGFLETAVETLHTIWGLDEFDSLDQSWVQRLRDKNENFLIV
ncbi:hypothetical protein G7046_g1015 [Stylonectria norvegica]|nr:hypothetical protein G7046_g1015 [Stylonectria norvegica]